MDNHQLEVANALKSRGHLMCGSTSNLASALDDFLSTHEQLVPLPKVNLDPFIALIDEELVQAGVKL
jgi:hypothetical protein